MIIGHTHILNFFETAKREGRLGHAYGFIGPGALGKRTVALHIAANLLGVTVEKLPQHPDYIYMERTENEKTGKLRKEISIEEARRLRARLQHTSWQEGNRVVIINEAELLNEESGNALLKLIEEPPARTIFFLIIENEAALLSTIRSRIQPFYFSLVKTREIVGGLLERGLESAKAEIFARRSNGRPGRALCFLEEEGLKKYEERLEIFKELVGAPLYKKIQLIEKLYGDKEDGERGRREWQDILDSWISWFRDWLLKKHGASQFASEPGLGATVSFGNMELVGIIESFQKVKKLLHQNVHPRLAIEEALLKI